VTAADGDVDCSGRPEQRWDVALSFAGAQRDYVEQVADSLKERGLRCFYDADHEVQLWGKHLTEALPVDLCRTSSGSGGIRIG
jgi:hypothetical protein